ncbi:MULTISPECIES: MurR/RpiR family transcriptional regulator [unclassified Enterococcus]|jgi:DNA-binding MurR/RpiR family transcriptional regulator|uniref:MurR/RpiR family transcriptional regulator n=1 Tax=unclassified Enterococcus TaxID=2608891 RepID=UPI0003528A8A|nr:transcriptional regulator, RpiR family [Enterococcus faecalis 13-SD-W-01]
MSVAGRIESMMEEYSSAEKKLAAYIIDNLEKIPTMTAIDLAKAAGSSAPTVVRFSKKIGFQSLTDFKITISTELQAGLNDGFSDIDPNEAFYSIKNKLGKNAQVAISETVDLLEEEKIQEVIKALDQVEVIYSYGVGASALVVEDILHKWSRVGKQVVFEKDIHVLLPQLVSNEKACVLWLVSNSGKSSDVVALADLAKQLGITVIALTQLGTNPLSKSADIVVQTSRPKEITNRSAATNSLLAQFATIDIIFYFYMAQNEELTQKVSTTRKAIQKYIKQIYK